MKFTSRSKIIFTLAIIGFSSVLWRQTLASAIPAIEMAGIAPSPFSTYLPLIRQAGTFAAIPSWSAPVAVSPLDASVWSVNPDAGSVSVMASVVNAVSMQKTAEISIGQMPWSLIFSPDGQRVYVLDRAAGTLVVIDAQAKAVETILSIGPEPGAMALTPSGLRAFITLTASDEVAVVNTVSLEQVATIPVIPKPYAIAISNDGDVDETDERVYVTHLQAVPRPGGEEARDNGREGRVTVIDPVTNAVAQEIALAPDEHGFPNLLMSITLFGSRAWVPYVRAAPDLPRGLTTTVFAAVSTLDLSQTQEDVAASLPLNDQEIFGSPVNNPVAAIPSPDGQTLYIVLAGSNLVEVVDISDPAQPRLIKFLPVGLNPRGLALSGDGRWGYVMNYLSRSITVLNLENLAWAAEIPVTSETLPTDVLQGKILFNNATDPRLSQGSWISCVSCHPDGGTDGVTWMFPDGPRQTPTLWNATQTLPWHWSAALDEAQDVEETIQLIQHGLGLAPGIDPPLLGPPNGGRSVALDALAAFMADGISIPVLPLPEEDVTEGRELFQAAGCVACHGGPTWTSSLLPGPAGTLDSDGNGMVDEMLKEVGSLNVRDVRGEMGFDPPSLLNIRLTAPYLHDGSMPTLEALLASGHPDPQGNGNGLDEAEIAELVPFLQSISVHTAPVETEKEE